MLTNVYIHENKTRIKYSKTLIVEGFWVVSVFFKILLYISHIYKEPVIF